MLLRDIAFEEELCQTGLNEDIAFEEESFFFPAPVPVLGSGSTDSTAPTQKPFLKPVPYQISPYLSYT